MGIKVSVIIPIYNAEKYLRQCINSVLKQSLKSIEIILINDGSADGSGTICEEFMRGDTRIKYLYKNNEGLAAARQDGIEMASGEYIGFVDSDDWIETDMYEKMYNAAKTNSADVVLCNAYENDEKKRRMPIASGPYDIYGIQNEILPKTLIGINEQGKRSNIRWSNCLRIYKKDMLDKHSVRFERKFRRCQDLPFTFFAMLHAKNFYYLDEFLYHNRQEPGSLSRGYTRNMWELIKPLIEYICELEKQYDKGKLRQLTYSTAFFLSLDCILNEFKLDAPKLTTRIKNIRTIMIDSVCGDALNKLNAQKLDNYYYKIFYNNMRKKNALGLVIEYYYYHSVLKKKIVSPILDILTENSVYKKIRLSLKGKTK